MSAILEKSKEVEAETASRIIVDLAVENRRLRKELSAARNQKKALCVGGPVDGKIVLGTKAYGNRFSTTKKAVYKPEMIQFWVPLDQTPEETFAIVCERYKR